MTEEEQELLDLLIGRVEALGADVKVLFKKVEALEKHHEVDGHIEEAE